METNIQKYLAFIRTVEFGSFTKAAEILGYSQSGISHMIKDLERECGFPLLERDRSGIRITSEGLQILPFAYNICEDHNNLQMQIDNINGLQTGLIRIGSFSSPATHWLPNIIKNFQKDYPNIDFELLLGNYTEIETWLTEGRLDCAFLLLPVQNDFYTISLKQDHLLVVMPVNHPLCKFDRIPIKELEKYPFMLSKNKSDSEVVELLERYNIKPHVRFTTWDDYVLMSMIEQGLGIGILSELILQRCPFQIIKKKLDVPATREIAFVLRDLKKAPLAVKRFMDYLQYRSLDCLD